LQEVLAEIHIAEGAAISALGAVLGGLDLVFDFIVHSFAVKLFR
jgi:hypothetical protein